jgi:uncharacterized membrane protein YcaP (DUF421 family)
MEDLFGIALRISFTYLYILALLRFSGKRSVDTLSPLDFLVGLIFGNLTGYIVWGNVPLSQGVVAITSIMLLHTLIAAIETHVTPFHHLVGSTPSLVVDHGSVQRNILRQERVAEDELWAELRLKEKDDLSEVREAYFEPGGQVSVLPTEAADEIQKQERQQVKDLVKQ